LQHRRSQQHFRFYAMGGQPFLALNVAAFIRIYRLRSTARSWRGGAEKRFEAVWSSRRHTVQDKSQIWNWLSWALSIRKMSPKVDVHPGDALVLDQTRSACGVTTTAI